jgi:hypothetical protein
MIATGWLFRKFAPTKLGKLRIHQRFVQTLPAQATLREPVTQTQCFGLHDIWNAKNKFQRRPNDMKPQSVALPPTGGPTAP